MSRAPSCLTARAQSPVWERRITRFLSCSLIKALVTRCHGGGSVTRLSFSDYLPVQQQGPTTLLEVQLAHGLVSLSRRTDAFRVDWVELSLLTISSFFHSFIRFFSSLFFSFCLSADRFPWRRPILCVPWHMYTVLRGILPCISRTSQAFGVKGRGEDLREPLITN